MISLNKPELDKILKDKRFTNEFRVELHMKTTSRVRDKQENVVGLIAHKFLQVQRKVDEVVVMPQTAQTRFSIALYNFNLITQKLNHIVSEILDKISGNTSKGETLLIQLKEMVPFLSKLF